jgi:flagellar assembly protein FliH
MSTEVGFSLAAFPAIRSDGRGPVETRGMARGHAAGYAAGIRAAADNTEALRDSLRAEHEAALVRMQSECDRAVAVLSAAARALNDRTLPVVVEAQDTLAAAAVDLAEAIIGHTLDDKKRAAHAALTRAIVQLDPVVRAVVRMNPDDLAVLDDNILSQTHVTLIPDPTLACGDAVSELPDGFLDARIGTALARAKAALLGCVQ